ncbi:hypothetical protein Tco_1026360 [Tanacetum coccineum]
MERKILIFVLVFKMKQDHATMLKTSKILKVSCSPNVLVALSHNFKRETEQGITKSEFERAFSHIFGEDVDTFTRTFSQNMDTLEQKLTKETILVNCRMLLEVLKTQFEKISALAKNALQKALGQESKEQDTSSRSGMMHMLRMQISRPKYDESLIVEYKQLLNSNIFATWTTAILST